MNKRHSTNLISWLSQLWKGILADFVSDPITGSASHILCNEALVRAKTPIIRRFSPKLRKYIPGWFASTFSHASLGLLNEEILGLTRFGIEVEETPSSVNVTFSSQRRLCHLLDQFENCYGFRKQLDKAKEWQSLLWTLRRRDLWSTMLNTRLWEQHFFSLFQAFG